MSYNTMTSVTIDPEYIVVIENINIMIIPNHIKEAGFDMVFKPVLFDCYSVWRYRFLKNVGYWNLPKDESTISRCNTIIIQAIKNKFLEN